MTSLLPLKSSTESLADRDLDPLFVDFGDTAADEILAVVTSSTAREILTALYDEPQTPSDVADVVGTSVQNVGYHLPRLQEAGLVEEVDTWYSGQGREMAVYAPANGPLVLFAGAERATPSLTSALERLVGAVGAIALTSVLVHVIWRTLHPPIRTMPARPAPDLLTQLGALVDRFLAGPGALTLAVGVGIVVILFLLWYWRRYRPGRRSQHLA